MGLRIFSLVYHAILVTREYGVPIYDFSSGTTRQVHGTIHQQQSLTKYQVNPSLNERRESNRVAHSYKASTQRQALTEMSHRRLRAAY